MKNKEDVIFYKKNQLSLNIESAISLICCQPELVRINNNVNIDLFEDNTALVNASFMQWGMLSKVTLSTRWKHLQLTKTVLLAEREKKRYSLYMPNNQKYVSLVGNSYINGDCSLSELGIRKGNIEGQYFEGPYLYSGNLHVSDKIMPKINEPASNYITSYLNGKTSSHDSIVNFNAYKNIEINHSFKEKTLFMQSNRKIVLEKGLLKGNIILSTTDTIEVWPGIELKNIVLFANTIIFKAGCHQTLQAFASRELIVESGCEFSYPSFLGCLSNVSKLKVSVDKGVLINGGVFVYSLNPEEGSTIFTLSEDATIYGKLYVNGDLYFKGNIIGSLICNRFAYSTSRSFYENFIVDGIIDGEKLPKEYASFCLENDEVFKLKLVAICQ
ncbi:hypothetical protein OM075_15610 [Marinilabiliaceae bacterium AAT]|uniref:Uncharacterized protein n=1 Tax=Plebeiibacterium sediminum TaxID=2992112 RepID=A0AAE3M6N4_9BACT|nr:hypothetical protein [Plebeiobacterium sediminum]